jgi:hypothetical protein
MAIGDDLDNVGVPFREALAVPPGAVGASAPRKAFLYDDHGRVRLRTPRIRMAMAVKLSGCDRTVHAR